MYNRVVRINCNTVTMYKITVTMYKIHDFASGMNSKILKMYKIMIRNIIIQLIMLLEPTTIQQIICEIMTG